MHAKIDFETASQLTKFLSDKLRANPGTKQPAKLLHWVAEFQGFRNAKALKAAPLLPIIGQGAYVNFSHHKGIAIGPFEPTALQTNELKSRSSEKSSVHNEILTRIESMVSDFVAWNRADIIEAHQTKKNNPDYNFEEGLYQGEWETVDRFSGYADEREALLVLSSLSEDVRKNLSDDVTNRGSLASPTNMVNHLYEEATKDVLVTVLRALTENFKVDQEPCDLHVQIKNAVDQCVPSWIGESNLGARS